ncbi:hypothetical protein ACVCGT_25585 [Klebsiella pneumoniae]
MALASACWYLAEENAGRIDSCWCSAHARQKLAEIITLVREVAGPQTIIFMKKWWSSAGHVRRFLPSAEIPLIFIRTCRGYHSECL